jgi:hypothetical protein
MNGNATAVYIAEQLKALQNWVRQAQAEVLRLNTEAQEN